MYAQKAICQSRRSDLFVHGVVGLIFLTRSLSDVPSSSDPALLQIRGQHISGPLWRQSQCFGASFGPCHAVSRSHIGHLKHLLSVFFREAQTDLLHPPLLCVGCALLLFDAGILWSASIRFPKQKVVCQRAIGSNWFPYKAFITKCFACNCFVWI